ncbi:hypothetical protein L6303_04330, partial [archaeon]|nr:hypothetical protein [archaeon]
IMIKNKKGNSMYKNILSVFLIPLVCVLFFFSLNACSVGDGDALYPAKGLEASSDDGDGTSYDGTCDSYEWSSDDQKLGEFCFEDDDCDGTLTCNNPDSVTKCGKCGNPAEKPDLKIVSLTVPSTVYENESYTDGATVVIKNEGGGAVIPLIIDFVQETI